MTTTEPILLDGQWVQMPADSSFRAMNPTTGDTLEFHFPVSTTATLEAMLTAGAQAVAELRTTSPSTIAAFLRNYAETLEANRTQIVAVAHEETALPSSARLDGELNRTMDQLRQGAWAAEERSWVMATIDTATNIRSMFGPINGPVVVFGPNNFPLAFNGVSGGDFAAAIASGNPVIAKANPAHPHTTKLLAEAAFAAMQTVAVPRALVQMFYHTADANGLKLVAHPQVGATAFTGSKAGLHLKQAADAAGKPIYLEMSSINPVFILPGVLAERLEDTAAELFASCTLGAGQFCTNPGLIMLLAGEQTERFIQAVQHRFKDTQPGILLTARGPEALVGVVQEWESAGAERITGGHPAADSSRFENTLYRVPAAKFLKQPARLQTEAFGTASLVVVAEDAAELLAVTACLDGNLTGAIYSHSQGEDDDLYDRLEPIVRSKVGRLLNDKMPTGVAVSPAMHHGGPFPATGHPGFTAVGIPASLRRFAALYSYDNIRPHRLPPELQNRNPTGTMWRYINRTWTQADVT